MTPETPHTPTKDAARFNQLILLCTLMRYDENEPSPVITPDGSARLRQQGIAYLKFQQRMLSLLDPNPRKEFSATLTEGNYGRIAKMAGKVAVEGMAALSEFRGRDHISLGDTFGLHALTSALTVVNRPHESKVAHSFDRSTYFLTHVAIALAMQVPERLLAGANYFAAIPQFEADTQALSRSIGQTPEWHERKLFMLADRLTVREHLTKLIDAEPAVETEDLKYARKNNDALFKELKRLRCYSIKSAVHTMGASEWSIHDSTPYETDVIAKESSQILLHQWPPHLLMIAIERFSSTHRLFVPQVGTEPEEVPNYEGMGRMVFMGEDGELYADVYGGASYATLYENAGKPQNYEALRQHLLQKLFDLTVPVQIVQEVAADTETMLRPTSGKTPKEAPLHLIADLLLPRIRRLKHFKTLGEFERTAATMEATETTEAKAAARRKHPVVAHPRDLPPGYKPSPEALALAKKLNIALGPNQTVVKDHNRGDETKGTITHKAKDRKKRK